jgi:hypothetical protein
MNLAYLVRSDLHGMQGFIGCPLCGFASYSLDSVIPHFKQWHSLPGQEWYLSSVKHPENPMHTFHIVTNTPLTEQQKKKDPNVP